MKLIFEGNGGYDLERESAREKLVVGHKYTVEKIEVGLTYEPRYVGYCEYEIDLTDFSGY